MTGLTRAEWDRGPWPPCPAPFNMAAHVLARAKDDPDKIALIVMGRSGAERWSYGRLEQAVRGTATGLLGAGIDPGQRLLLRLGNTVDYPIAYLGAISADIVPVPTSPQLTEEEVARLIADLRPEAVAHDPAIACPETGPRRLSPETLRAFHDLPPVRVQVGDPDRPAYIVYTSGTAGRARGVVHAHRAIWARGMMFEGWYGLTSEDRLLHAGAFNWTFTMGTGLLDPWTIGATALIPEPGIPPEALPHLLKRHDATIFAAAPAVYRKMLKSSPRLDLPRLRHGLSAGEKLPPATRAAWRAATGTEVYEAFGMSECSTFISSSPAAPADPATLGRPQPGRHVAILREGRPASIGEEGEIAVHRGDPGVMLEYLDAPEETAARFSGDWYLTGDRGAMDAEGQVTYMGRADDMMNAGGFRVSPLEVEAAMATCPGLTGCAAVELPVKEGVSVIALFYTAAAALPEAALAAHAESHLARYKQPRLFRHIDALPVNPNGKVLRKTLRERYQRGHGET